jgi:hypothetical protein
VIDIACRADLTSDELTRARSVVEAPLLSGGATAALETSEPTPPLFVFADVDRLSDQQIKEIFERTQNGDQKGTAVLLLAPSEFLIRLEQPSLQFLTERLVARFEFYEVGQEEGIEFLRHQLTERHARGEPRGIPPGIFRILAASGVLLAVGISAFLFLQNYQLVGEPSVGSRLALCRRGRPVIPASMNGRRGLTPELPYSDPIMLGSPYSAANSNSSAERLAVATMPTSAVRDHDLPEMCASLKVTVGFLCLPEREGPVDHGAQTMYLDGAVHGLEIGAASNTDRSERDTTAGEQ